LVGVAVLGFVASATANWPGHFPPDAIAELAQGRHGVFNLWHPPVTAWLLGLADRISPDAGAFILFDAGLLCASLLAFSFLERPSWLSVVVLALLAASPLALIYQGLVVKDVLFADVVVAAFASIAWAAKLWERHVARSAMNLLALALLILAALIRQNGAVVAATGCLTLASLAAVKAPRRARRMSFVASATASAILVTIGVFIASQAFVAHSDGQPEEARQWMALQIYDLAGETRRDPALRLPVLERDSPALEAFVRRQAVPAYDVTRADPILNLSAWANLVRTPTPWAGVQWRAIALADPGLYLRTRWVAFWQVLATPKVGACAPVLVGVDSGNPKLLAAAGLAARDTDKDDWDGDYASAFLGTPVFSHLVWGALALVLLALAVRDLAFGRRPEMIATCGLIVGAAAFAATFFVISLACDYRYLYLIDVAAMVALIQRLSLRPVA
jgi:hypothetical protein